MLPDPFAPHPDPLRPAHGPEPDESRTWKDVLPSPAAAGLIFLAASVTGAAVLFVLAGLLLAGVAAVAEGVGQAIEKSIGAGLGGPLHPAVAAAAGTPVPPPVGGTAAQAGALGERMAAAVAAGDQEAAAALLDWGSLTRGFFPPAYAAAVSAGSPSAPQPADVPTPPGALTVALYQSILLGMPFHFAQPPHGSVRSDGVREVDGLPAAAFTVTLVPQPEPGEEPSAFERPDGKGPGEPYEFRVFLLPGPDGRLAAIYHEGLPHAFAATPPAFFTGYHADLLRATLNWAGENVRAGREPFEGPDAGSGDDEPSATRGPAGG